MPLSLHELSAKASKKKMLFLPGAVYEVLRDDGEGGKPLICTNMNLM
jgi:hypothetical protein